MMSVQTRRAGGWTFRGALAAAVLGGWLCGAGQAQPANDLCANATVLPGTGTFNGTTVGATSDIAASSCAATADDTIDVWYRFTHTGGGNQAYNFNTDGTPDTGGNAGDTSIELFDFCGGAQTSLGCDDDAGAGLNSRVIYTMAPGQTIRIRVAFVSTCADPPGCTFMGTVTGPFVLNVSAQLPQAPANDLCANATVIAAAPSMTPGDNDLSTGVDITPCSNTDELDVWFTFTPATTGQYQIDTFGSTGNDDTSLAVFQGCPNETTPLVQQGWPSTLLACNDDVDNVALTDLLSAVRVNLMAGTAYKIRVSGFGNTTGEFRVSISAPNPTLIPAPPDTCATAQVVSGTFSGSIYTASARPDAPAGTCNTATAIAAGGLDNAVWYTFTPGSNGALSGSIDTSRGIVTSVSQVLLLTGPCGGPYTELACQVLNPDAPAPFNLSTLPALTAGTTYLLVIGDQGLFDSGGDIILSITVPGGGGGTGACCCGTTCSVTTAAACAGANRGFEGAGTVCNAGGNSTAPCCRSDYNQSGGAATVQDIFDFLSGYFGASACADFNGGGVSVQDIFDFLSAYFAGGCS